MFEILTIGKRKTNGANVGFGLFGAGRVGSSSTLLTTNKYLFSNATVTNGANLSVYRYDHTAYGNSSVGLFAGGSDALANNYTLHREEYIYDADSVKSSASLSLARSHTASTSNQVIGYVAGGFRSSGSAVATGDMYYYANRTNTAAAALRSARYGHAACGNASLGVFAAGDTPNVWYTDIYSYANNSTAAGSSLAYREFYLTAAGNETFGLFVGGAIDRTAVRKYSYSNNSYTSGTRLSTDKLYASGTGNKVNSIFAGNSDGKSTIETYVYSGDVVTNSSSLGLNNISLRERSAATSSSPGGF